MEQMSSDEDDPVVEEINVYLSKQLSQNLLLLQYPVRPSQFTYDNVCHLAARAKPKQLQLEMELAIDTKSPNYATSKGEQIALNVDGGESSEQSYYKSNKMDKQVLRSMLSGIEPGRYAVGALKDGELHLTPLRGVVQMRPGFGYLDKADSRTQKIQDVDEDSQDDDEARPIVVSFARQESKEAKARRLASYDFMKKKEDEEQWVNVAYHQPNTGMAESERCLLYATMSDKISEFYMTSSDYLKQLIPREEVTEEKRPAMPNNVLSMADLKTMPLGEQIRALLISAKVIHFNQLMSLLPKGTDITTVLRFVQQVALLIQGCWVVKSEVLYPPDSFSAHSGIPAETLCRGRDYIMWRFVHNRYLVRKDIASVIRLPAEDVKEILEQMARFRVHKGWEFVMECDHEFMIRHPEVAQRQQMLWDRKFEQLAQILSVTKTDLKLAANAVANPGMTSPKRRRTTSRSRSKSGGEMSISDHSDVDVDGQKSEERRHGSGLGHQHNNSGALVDVSSKFVENGMDLEMPASSDSNGITVDLNALRDELVRYAADRLSSRFVLCMSDFKRLFLQKLAECPPGHIFGSGVSDKQLEESLLLAGAQKFSFGPNTDSIFILNRVRDGRDNLRDVLIGLLREKPQIRLNSFRKRIEELGMEIPSDSDLRKLLKDYCVSKGAIWMLKCTRQQNDS